jgi:hypothetical protein
MDIGQLDEGRLLGDKEDVFFEHKKIPLDSFEVGFDSGMPVATVVIRS